jgi:hypothetical protein
MKACNRTSSFFIARNNPEAVYFAIESAKLAIGWRIGTVVHYAIALAQLSKLETAASHIARVLVHFCHVPNSNKNKSAFLFLFS